MDIIPITDDSEAMEAARKEAEAVEAQIKLFQGLKFFIGREVRYPPPPFVLVTGNVFSLIEKFHNGRKIYFLVYLLFFVFEWEIFE